MQEMNIKKISPQFATPYSYNSITGERQRLTEGKREIMWWWAQPNKVICGLPGGVGTHTASSSINLLKYFRKQMTKSSCFKQTPTTDHSSLFPAFSPPSTIQQLKPQWMSISARDPQTESVLLGWTSYWLFNILILPRPVQLTEI